MTERTAIVTEEERRRRKEAKRRLVRTTIVVGLLLLALFTWLETRVFSLGQVPFPVSGNVLVFVLINVNVLLLLVVAYLVLRGLAELVFERHRQLLGSRLRTKLVVSFIALSLVPTGLLFFIALQFVSTSMDYWFNSSVEDSLVRSLELAKASYRRHRQQASMQHVWVAARLADLGAADDLSAALERLRREGDMAAIALYRNDESLVARVGDEGGRLGTATLRRVLAGDTVVDSVSDAAGELVRVAARVPVLPTGEPGVLVIAHRITATELDDLTSISRGLEGYRQLMVLKRPIKASLLVLLLIVTLLIVFAAIWFGFYVANSLTGPIGKLAEATRRVAGGELDFELERESDDEMGTLVDAFNRMTRDLRHSRREVQAANDALRQSLAALEERRRYTEIILRNVTAGVISLDAEGRVSTINRYAEELLALDGNQLVGRHYRSILRAAHLSILEGYLDELATSGRPSIQRLVRITIGGETFSLRVNFVRLEDEEGRPLGVVIVFDNLTELEKAQRMAAWREVARRIAHEVKNPLTPIQLSAQRLRKKYGGTLDDEVFDTCTRTIIDQVEELKKLVGEFSSFARMPGIKKTVQDVRPMLDELVTLYQQAHPEIRFQRNLEPVAPFAFDQPQLKRVVVNLLDNAVAALAGGGTIAVHCRTSGDGVEIVVEDDGPGVAETERQRLFEPYYSTKKSGTGLGLAIASTIVADHGGTITMENRSPHGARFIVRLPAGDTDDGPTGRNRTNFTTGENENDTTAHGRGSNGQGQATA